MLHRGWPSTLSLPVHVDTQRLWPLMEPLRGRIGRTSVVTLRPLSMSIMIWNEGGRGRGGEFGLLVWDPEDLYEREDNYPADNQENHYCRDTIFEIFVIIFIPTPRYTPRWVLAVAIRAVTSLPPIPKACRFSANLMSTFSARY